MLTRGLRHEHDANSKNQSREDLNCNRNQPGCSTLAISHTANVIRAVSDPVRDHDAEREMSRVVVSEMSVYRTSRGHSPKSNGQLLQRHQSTSSLCRCDLCVVERYDHTQRANAETGDESASQNVVVVSAVNAGLHNDTDREDEASNDDRKLSSEPVRRVAVCQHADPSAQLENGGEKTGQGGV